MGTNYYYHEKPPCECCDRPFEPLHIGKSSAGWCFSLHVIPEQDINSLDDWRRKWLARGVIIDENGRKVTPEQMLDVITNRSHPRGLSRHEVGPHCVAHGEGTWDLIPGWFS
jgi:hypothetical protein